MKTLRILSLLTALALPMLSVGCSHEDDRSDEPRTTRSSSGGERRVAARDTDRDGTADTVVAEDDSQVTAMDQSESAEDLEITRQIRAEVVGDSSLSFGARNCVIVTRGGVVTLRGDVTSAESEAIERHAQRAAGVLRVDNHLNTTDQASTR